MEMTEAKTDVVELFAVFHDSQRINDGIDMDMAAVVPGLPENCVALIMILLTRTLSFSSKLVTFTPRVIWAVI